MKHVFIINPAAGKKDSTQKIYAMAERLRRDHDQEVEPFRISSTRPTRSFAAFAILASEGWISAWKAVLTRRSAI